jgi:hypothetical protein
MTVNWALLQEGGKDEESTLFYVFIIILIHKGGAGILAVSSFQVMTS